MKHLKTKYELRQKWAYNNIVIIPSISYRDIMAH